MRSLAILSDFRRTVTTNRHLAISKVRAKHYSESCCVYNNLHPFASKLTTTRIPSLPSMITRLSIENDSTRPRIRLEMRGCVTPIKRATCAWQRRDCAMVQKSPTTIHRSEAFPRLSRNPQISQILARLDDHERDADLAIPDSVNQ